MIKKAGVVLYRKREKEIEVLLVKRKKQGWSLPKGKIEKGERTIDAARRELKEEAGVTMGRKAKPLGSVKGKSHVHLKCFHEEFNEKRKPEARNEISKVKFMSLKKARLAVDKYQLPLLRSLSSQIA